MSSFVKQTKLTPPLPIIPLGRRAVPTLKIRRSPAQVVVDKLPGQRRPAPRIDDVADELAVVVAQVVQNVPKLLGVPIEEDGTTGTQQGGRLGWGVWRIQMSVESHLSLPGATELITNIPPSLVAAHPSLSWEGAGKFVLRSCPFLFAVDVSCFC